MQAELRRVEDEVDQAAAQLWGVSVVELKDIYTSSRELKG